MFKHVNLFFKIIFILNFFNSYCTITEKLEKIDSDIKLHSAIDILINNTNSGPIESEEVKLWLEKNLEQLKPHINSKFAYLTPLARYFRNHHPIDLLEFDSWKNLIKMGADPNEIIKWGSPFKDKEPYKGSLLHYCAIKNDLNSAKFLKDYKINIELLDNLDRTALHIAILNGSQDIINFLIIDCQSNLNIQDVFGQTPLHLAVQGNNIATIKLLKIYDANPFIKDIKRKIPIKLAVEQKNLEAIKNLDPILYEKITKKSRNCDII